MLPTIRKNTTHSFRRQLTQASHETGTAEDELRVAGMLDKDRLETISSGSRTRLQVLRDGSGTSLREEPPAKHSSRGTSTIRAIEWRDGGSSRKPRTTHSPEGKPVPLRPNRPRPGDNPLTTAANSVHSGRLVLASHRGPIEYHRDRNGQSDIRHGSGGLVTALSGLAPLADFAWVASAMTEGDRQMASQRGPRSNIQLGAGQCHHRFVVLPKHIYDLHYSVFSNPILWLLQHSLWDSLSSPTIKQKMRRAWTGGYLPANRAFARAIVNELNGNRLPSYVMTQDYHLYMCPSYVREMAPQAILQHFLHIPWPAPEVWEDIPARVHRGDLSQPPHERHCRIPDEGLRPQLPPHL